MSNEVEILHDKLANRFRALKAAGAFFDKPPAEVFEVLKLFDMRDYEGCKKKAGSLINARAWVAFGSVVATGCDELIDLIGPQTKSVKVEVIR